MKRLILSVLAVFAIAAVVVGCGTSNTSGSSSSDMELLQGTWTEPLTESCDTPPCTTDTLTVTFSGNNWTLTSTYSLTDQTSGTFTIDSTANPKTIDLYTTTTTHPSSSQIGKTDLGLYLLSGTNLMLAINATGSARPTSFTADDTIYFVKQ